MILFNTSFFGMAIGMFVSGAMAALISMACSTTLLGIYMVLKRRYGRGFFPHLLIALGLFRIQNNPISRDKVFHT